ncbi:MAG: serine/threonine-protein kinase [Nanobdellota archaeon]
MYDEVSELSINMDDFRWVWIEDLIADEQTRIKQILGKDISQPYENLLARIKEGVHVHKGASEELIIQRPYFKIANKLINLYRQFGESDNLVKVQRELPGYLEKNIDEGNYKAFLNNIREIETANIGELEVTLYSKLFGIDNSNLIDKDGIPIRDYVYLAIHNKAWGKFNSLMGVIDNLRDEKREEDKIYDFVNLSIERAFYHKIIGEKDEAISKLKEIKSFPFHPLFFEFGSMMKDLNEDYDYRNHIKRFMDAAYEESKLGCISLLSHLVGSHRGEWVNRHREIIEELDNPRKTAGCEKVHLEMLMNYIPQIIHEKVDDRMALYSSILQCIRPLSEKLDPETFNPVLEHIRDFALEEFPLGSNVEEDRASLFPGLIGSYAKIGRTEDARFLMNYMRSFTMVRKEETSLFKKPGHPLLVSAEEEAYLSEYYLRDDDYSIRAFQSVIDLIKPNIDFVSLRQKWFKPMDYKRIDYINRELRRHANDLMDEGRIHEGLNLLKEIQQEEKELKEKNPDHLYRSELDANFGLIDRLVKAYCRQNEALLRQKRFNEAVSNIQEMRKLVRNHGILDYHAVRCYQTANDIIFRIKEEIPQYLDEILSFDENITVADAVLVKKLGSGVSGKTYLGYSPYMHKELAIKVMDSLNEEARFLAGLDHKNIVRIYSAGKGHASKDGFRKYAIVMDYVEGKTLAEIINEGIEKNQAIDYSRQLLEGINYLYSNNVFHRDINMSNVMIAKDGVLKIVDFGIAASTSSGPKDNRRYGGPSDLFSWGLITYQMMSGKHLILERSDSLDSQLYADEVEKMKSDIYQEDGALRADYINRLNAIPSPLNEYIAVSFIARPDRHEEILERLRMNMRHLHSEDFGRRKIEP